MGISSAMGMTVIVAAGVFVSNRLDPRCGYRANSAEIRRLDQSVQPALKVQPVNDEDVRLAHRTGGGRGRSVNMRIPIWPDERDDGHMLATYARHHVAKYREGSHSPYRPVELVRSGNGKRQ